MSNKIKSVSEIKAGMVVKVKDFVNGPEHALVVPVRHCPDDYEFLAVSGPTIWNDVRKFDENFTYGHRSILEVWGLSFARGGHKLSNEDRKLLWSRELVETTVEMTMAEVEKLVGKKVKIVKED